MKKRSDSLADRLRTGNREAAAELVDIYYERIYLFMRKLGHSCQVSEDLTQESLLHVWEHIGQLRSDESLNSWMYRIAVNVSKMYWRSIKNTDALSIEGVDVADDKEVGFDKMEHLEQLRWLRDAVLKLPIKLRQTVVLRYMEHLTIGEAAEAAGVRQSTFKSRLNRALKSLKKEIN